MIGIYVSGKLVAEARSGTKIGIVTTGQCRTGSIRFQTIKAGDLPKRMPRTALKSGSPPLESTAPRQELAR